MNFSRRDYIEANAVLWRENLLDSFYLLDKQKHCIRILKKGDVSYLLYGGAAGGGKAQPLTSKVLTPWGFTEMGNIKVGSIIMHPSGTNQRVIAIHPQGQKLIFEITFSDGAKTRCCKDHLWNYWQSSKKSKLENGTGIKGKIATTEMLAEYLRRGRKLIIPLCKPINFSTTSRYQRDIDKFSPYMIGVLLGDGCLRGDHITFTSDDLEIVERIRRELPEGYSLNKYSDKYTYSIVYNLKSKANPLIDLFRDWELMGKRSEEKEIPKAYFTASLEIRKALVQGLMDSDGTASKDGKVRFSSSSIKLAEGMQELLRSLGAKATLRKKETTHLDSFRLFIQSNNNEDFFHLTRKKERCTSFNGGNAEAGRRISSIKLVGKEVCQCITVESPDGLYITDDYIVTHNSWLICEWLLWNGLSYPGTKWFIGRETLKKLRRSTLLTFLKVAKKYKLKRREKNSETDWDYRINFQDNYIELYNGAQIDLLDLKYQPTDPLFEDLGSLEYTGGALEEAGEIEFAAFDVLKSRVGREKNDKYNLPRTILITCNPKKGWLKRRFHDPWKKGTLENPYGFIQSFFTDNKYRESAYEIGLDELEDKSLKLRLKLGEWEYEDNPYRIISDEGIHELKNNTWVGGSGRFITADVARHGSDFFVIMVWYGWAIKAIKVLEKCDLHHAYDLIEAERMKHNIPKSKVIVDEEGVGGGMVDFSQGYKGFVSSRAAVIDDQEKERYENIATQCAFYVARKINANQLHLDVVFEKDKYEEMLIADLEAIERKPRNENESIKLVKKEDIKVKLSGRSPDFWDAMKMRAWFELNKSPIDESMFFA